MDQSPAPVRSFHQLVFQASPNPSVVQSASGAAELVHRNPQRALTKDRLKAKDSRPERLSFESQTQ